MMSDPLLMVCNTSPHDGRYFLISGRGRRWIPSGDHMNAYGFNWDSVKPVFADQLEKYPLSAPLALVEWEGRADTFRDLAKDVIARELRGRGLQFAAGASPFPAALDATMEYADLDEKEIMDSQPLRRFADPNQVPVHYQAGPELMDAIPEGVYDFILLIHLIEHARNPLIVIENAWRKLKSGGKLVICVTDHDHSINASRKLTTLAHVILDYKRPLEERDFLHMVEFFEKAAVSPNPYESAMEESVKVKTTVHFHTWNERTFLELLEYASLNHGAWKDISSYSGDSGTELYFTMIKD